MTGASNTVVIAVLSLILCSPLTGQTAPERAQQALERLAAGDAAGAVAVLEPIRELPDTPPRLMALLGTAYLESGRAEEAMAVLQPLADAENADPAVLYNAGRAALATGADAQAETYLERSLELQPGTPAARELGLLRGRQGRMRSAYRLLLPWITSNPDDIEARLAAALAAIRLQRLPEVEAMLDGLPLENPRVRLLWGKARLMQADPRGALTMLEPALDEETGSEELDIRRTAAEAYLAIGDAAKAVNLLEGRGDKDPATALQLAKAQYQTGDLDGAIATLSPYAERLLQVVRARGEEMGRIDLAADYSLEYGRLLSNAGRREDALVYLELATQFDSSQKEAWQTLGQTLAGLGRRDEATAALERFRELAEAEGPTTVHRERQELDAEDPTGREVRVALQLMAEGKGDQALGVLRAEKELAPDDIRLWLLESRALILEARPAEGLTVAEETVQRFPEYVDSYYQRGTAHLAMEHFEEAEEDLRRALDLDPDHIPSMNDLAVLLIVQDRKAEARLLLQRVLELQPEDPQARQTLENMQSGSSR